VGGSATTSPTSRHCRARRRSQPLGAADPLPYPLHGRPCRVDQLETPTGSPRSGTYPYQYPNQPPAHSGVLLRSVREIEKPPERAGRAQSGVCGSWMGLFAWDRVLYVGDRARLRSLFDMKSARLSHHQARRWNGVQSLPKPRRVPRSGTGTVVGGLGKVAAGHAWLRAATSAASVQGQPGPNPDYHPGALSSGEGTISRFT
jgi:hypothetical protein